MDAFWYQRRSALPSASLKGDNAAWIPGGAPRCGEQFPADYLKGPSLLIGGMIANVLSQFSFRCGDSPDLVRYKEVLEAVVRDVRGSSFVDLGLRTAL